jgi:hypothetical protein
MREQVQKLLDLGLERVLLFFVGLGHGFGPLFLWFSDFGYACRWLKVSTLMIERLWAVRKRFSSDEEVRSIGQLA